MSRPSLFGARKPGRGAWLLVAAIAGGSCLAAEPATATAAAAVQPASAEMVDASGKPVDMAQALQRLRGARYLLLGEIHDNPEHHRVRAELLRALLADGVPTWVVFEQIDGQHSAAIEAAPRSTDAVVEAGRLDRKGWAWPLHRPLFDAALEGSATVIGGNLSRAEASGVVRGGLAQAPQELRRYLTDAGDEGTPSSWTAAQDAELIRQVDEGHCGALPPKMIAPMALAQRARDAALASAMVRAPAGTRVVLIAGNGHVRSDIGVPHYLRAGGTAASDRTQRGNQPIVSLGLLERAPDGSTSVDGPYDEAWFTTRVARPDPCEGMRASGASK